MLAGMTAAAVQVLLDDDDREALRLLVQRRSTPHRVKVRARAVCLLGEHRTITAVAQALKVSDDSVSRWARRWVAGGIEALFDAPKAGRPPRYGPAVRARIIELATRTRPDADRGGADRGGAGRASSHPSVREIARTLAAEGIAISASQVARVLAADEVRPHRVAAWVNRREDTPEAADAF